MDRPFTLLDFLSYLCELGLINFFLPTFLCFNDAPKRSVKHLTQILDVCVKKRIVLSLEKSHFNVREGIVLWHLVSSNRLEVDKAKVEVIQDLALPKSIRELRSFLRHVGFYRQPPWPTSLK